MAKYEIINVTDRVVGRCNLIFYPNKSVIVDLKPGQDKYTQIKACVALKMKLISERKKESIVSHVSKVSNESEVKVPDVVIKNGSDNKQESTSKPIDDATNNKTLTDKDGNLGCPYCDYVGTRKGMYVHVNQKHPEKYQEFKSKLNSI